MGKFGFKGITIGLGSIKWIIHRQILVEQSGFPRA